MIIGQNAQYWALDCNQKIAYNSLSYGGDGPLTSCVLIARACDQKDPELKRCSGEDVANALSAVLADCGYLHG